MDMHESCIYKVSYINNSDDKKIEIKAKERIMFMKVEGMKEKSWKYLAQLNNKFSEAVDKLQLSYDAECNTGFFFTSYLYLRKLLHEPVSE